MYIDFEFIGMFLIATSIWAICGYVFSEWFEEKFRDYIFCRTGLLVYVAITGIVFLIIDMSMR